MYKKAQENLIETQAQTFIHSEKSYKNTKRQTMTHKEKIFKVKQTKHYEEKDIHK